VRRLLAAILLALAAACAPAAAQTPERVEVWAVGDAATPNDGARRLAAYIRSQRPDRFLYLGDVYEDGTAREFRLNYDPLYGSLARITDPTPGNHEWENRFSGYYPYWRAKKGRRQPPWSSASIAGWQILALNSMADHGPGSRQLRWLRRQIRATAGDCRIAFAHAPRYSAGVYEDDPGMAPLWNALRGHARAFLSGHDHNLQRLRPVSGMTQYIAGAGGATVYAIDEDDPQLAWGVSGLFGALRIALEPGLATFEFRDSRGRLLDRSRRRCST
jgi:calcineurin-like phosphoesterase family protein